ncbi:putative Protein kinase domain-containing protein [Seiridium cardinale]
MEDVSESIELDHQVRDALQTCDVDFGDQEFLPNDQMDKLMTAEHIELALRKENVSPIPDLIDYVLSSAGRVFLTLVTTGNLPALVNLKTEGFRDENLPIQRVKKSQSDIGSWDESTKAVGTKRWTTFVGWKNHLVDSFIANQWKFLAPTFGRGNFVRVFQRVQPLPFITPGGITVRRRGHFSLVLRVGVHSAHADPELFNEVDANVSEVAVKIFNRGLEEDFYREMETLRIIKELEHDHLVKPIAAFENGSLQCFIFPWAEGGNLRDFWKRKDSALSGRPMRNEETVSWVLTQMRGLANCLKLLWDANCRHGDLKPENILLNGQGNMVIADVGLSKIHTAVTEKRNKSSSAKFATRRYAAPEIYMDDRHMPLSRDYDIWSIGVVLLEWITWLLHGDSKLRDYAAVDTLWNLTNGKHEVHPKTRVWISEIKDDLSADTALKDIIELIETRLLIIELSEEGESQSIGRAKATWLSMRMDNICERARREAPYRYDPRIWQRTRDSATTGANLDVPLQHRPRIAKLPSSDSIRDSVGGSTNDNIPKINIQSTDGQTTQPILTLAVVPDEYNEFHRRTLKDVWDSEPDNEFASSIFDLVKWTTLKPSSSPSTVCSSCRSMASWANRSEFPYDMRALDSRGQDCDLCRLIYESLLASEVKRDSSGKLLRVGSTLRNDSSASPIISIYVDPPADVERFPLPFAQLGLPQLPQPSSETQATIFRQWLRTCDHDHKCLVTSQSRDNFKMPTRLIDVGTSSEPSLRLVETAGMAYNKYVALSHCWGDVPEHLKLCTYRSNIEAFKQDIEFARLPQNFKDVVTVTRTLSIRYVWIDSLCIIQKDKYDWEIEAGNMELVFSAAYCTIAADSAESSLAGFLHKREPRPCVTVKSQASQLHFCKAIDDFHHDVEKSVLNTRGWVLQERALSRRTIHFSANQAYFECGQGVRCETLAKLRNPKAEFLEDPDFPRSALKHFKAQRQVFFHDLYSMYSKLTFRYPTDRSVGLLGLERRLARTFGTQADYGIFESYLHRSLLWMPESREKLKRILYEDRSVPSWSWMAYTGAIKYVDAPFNGVEWNTKDVKNPFAPGPLRQSTSTNKQKPVAELEAVAHQFHASTFSMFEKLKRCTFDTEPHDDLTPLRCVVLGKDKAGSEQDRSIYVLIVKPAFPETRYGIWKRVGVACILSSHMSERSGISVRIH